jgi:chaperonin cofactor prefoldin
MNAFPYYMKSSFVAKVVSLQTELETLSATFKQLEHQKEVAQKRLDDLAVQVRTS